MPWKTINKKQIYSVDFTSNISDNHLDLAKSIRKKHALEIQYFSTFDKDKIIKKLLSDYKTRYKASDFVVKWLEGDPKYYCVNSKYMSKDMSGYADYLFSYIQDK